MNIKKMVYQKIKNMTSNKFNDDSNIRDIGIDSLDFVELITEVEEDFKIKINNSEFDNIKTIKDVINILNKKIAQKK